MGTGVAAVTTLVMHDAAERCTGCQDFHTVETGGPAAALAAAVHYLDAYHQWDHLRKAQSEIRGLDPDPSAKTGPIPKTLFHTSRGVGVL
jgi:hypothetical protein